MRVRLGERSDWLLAGAFGVALCPWIGDRVTYAGCTILVGLSLAAAVASSWLPARPTRGRQRDVRWLAVTAGALVLAGVLFARWGGQSFACFSPIDPATGAPCRVVEPLGVRVGFQALALLVVSLGLRGGRGHPAPVGIALWLSTRLLVDAAALHAAMTACDDPAGAAELNHLAAASSAVELIGVTLTVVWITWALLRSALRGAPAMVGWPVLLVLLFASSSAFEPPLSTGFPQSRPEAIWRELGVAPLRLDSEGHGASFLMTRDPSHASFVLESGRRTHVFGAGTHRVLEPGDVVDLGTFYATPVLLTRGVTLDDLRAALPHLRRANTIELAFLRGESPGWTAAMARWPFVDMALRDVRAHPVEVWREAGADCATTAGATRCHHPRWRDLEQTYLLLDELETLSLPMILGEGSGHAPAALAVHLDAELHPGERLVKLDHGVPRPPERSPFELGVTPWAAGLGVLLAVLALLLSPLVPVRWALRWRAGRATARLPRNARLLLREGSPCRGRRVLMTASRRRILALMAGRIARAIPGLLWRVGLWLTVVALSGGLGALIASPPIWGFWR